MARHRSGSLTKEFPFDQIKRTILAIVPGMTIAKLEEFAANRTHRNIPILLANRYLESVP